jgi:hypothetical protein
MHKKGAFNRIFQKALLFVTSLGQPTLLFSRPAGAIGWPENISGLSICYSFIILFDYFSVSPVQ